MPLLFQRATTGLPSCLFTPTSCHPPVTTAATAATSVDHSRCTDQAHANLCTRARDREPACPLLPQRVAPVPSICSPPHITVARLNSSALYPSSYVDLPRVDSHRKPGSDMVSRLSSSVPGRPPAVPHSSRRQPITHVTLRPRPTSSCKTPNRPPLCYFSKHSTISLSPASVAPESSCLLRSYPDVAILSNSCENESPYEISSGPESPSSNGWDIRKGEINYVQLGRTIEVLRHELPGLFRKGLITYCIYSPHLVLTDDLTNFSLKGRQKYRLFLACLRHSLKCPYYDVSLRIVGMEHSPATSCSRAYRMPRRADDLSVSLRVRWIVTAYPRSLFTHAPGPDSKVYEGMFLYRFGPDGLVWEHRVCSVEPNVPRPLAMDWWGWRFVGMRYGIPG